MKIVIDARMYGPKGYTGIGRYLQELVLELERLDRRNQYVVLLGRDTYDRYTPASARFTKVLAPYRHYSLAEQLRLPWVLYRLKPDLVHFPSFNAPLLYRGRKVTTIHDLTTVLFAARRKPGLSGALKRLLVYPARLIMWRMATSSQALLTPSEYVKEALADRYRLERPKITVTPESVDVSRSGPADPPPSPPRGPYLYYTGNYYPHKNIERLIDAFEIVHRSHPDLNLVLGGKFDYSFAAIQRLVRERGLDPYVRYPGFVSDAQLTWLYAHATAFVFPSLSEGFGLTGLEAMAMGAPVIAADATCLPEIYGDAAAYFNATDPADMARVLGRVVGDPAEQAHLKAAGSARVDEFSWRRMAQQTLEVYNRLG